MKILVPVDGSPFTKRMLAYLAAHDEWLGDAHQYTLLHVAAAVPPRAAAALDKAVFPMMQGGPLMHAVAAKAVRSRRVPKAVASKAATSHVATAAVAKLVVARDGEKAATTTATKRAVKAVAKDARAAIAVTAGGATHQRQKAATPTRCHWTRRSVTRLKRRKASHAASAIAAHAVTTAAANRAPKARKCAQTHLKASLSWQQKV